MLMLQYFISSRQFNIITTITHIAYKSKLPLTSHIIINSLSAQAQSSSFPCKERCCSLSLDLSMKKAGHLIKNIFHFK